jgi:hypothetical protein
MSGAIVIIRRKICKKDVRADFHFETTPPRERVHQHRRNKVDNRADYLEYFYLNR